MSSAFDQQSPAHQPNTASSLNSHFEIQRENPCRRPTWLRDFASDAAYLGQPLALAEIDPQLGLALQMLNALQTGTRPEGVTRFAAEYDDLLTAHQIFVTDGLQRSELEARVLALTRTLSGVPLSASYTSSRATPLPPPAPTGVV